MTSISREGKIFGPYTDEQIFSLLSSGDLQPLDMARIDGEQEWQPISIMFEGLIQTPRKSLNNLPSDGGKNKFTKQKFPTFKIIAAVLIAFLGLGGCSYLLNHLANESMKPLGAEDFYFSATETVRNHLKSPSSAVFPPLDGKGGYCWNIHGGYWEASGWVDSQNVIGVMLRKSWRMIWNVNTRKVIFYQFDGVDITGSDSEALKIANSEQ